MSKETVTGGMTPHFSPEVCKWLESYANTLEHFANTTYAQNNPDPYMQGIGEGYLTVVCDLRDALERIN